MHETESLSGLVSDYNIPYCESGNVSSYPMKDPASLPQAMRIFEISEKLIIGKLVVTGVSNIKIPINLQKGIYTVTMFSGGLQMAAQKIMAY